MSSNTNSIKKSLHNSKFSSTNLYKSRMSSYPFMESQSNQSLFKDLISLYASTPFESNDKSFNISSNKSLKEVFKKTKSKKIKNDVEIEGKCNIEWWEKGNGRRQWSYGEDMLLVQLVQRYGAKNWARIAEKFPLRIGKQCRERWQNYLRPNIMKNEWSEEEDKLLISLHQQFGNKWADMAKRIPGRTENNIKNHWNATKRKQYLSKNYEKTKNPSSLLKDYITSISSSSSFTHQINIQQPQPPVAPTTTDSVVGYKPAELATDEMDFGFYFDDVSSQLVDELVFDPTKEMDFLKLFCQ